MPKRSFEERFDYYMKKMEKLRDKHRRKRRHRDNTISSSDDGDQGTETMSWNVTDPLSEGEVQPEAVIGEPDVIPDIEVPHQEIVPEAGTSYQNDTPPVLAIPPACATASSPRYAPEAPPEPLLDPEILSALGEATDQGPVWGQEIHKNLTQLWEPLLKKGMNKEIRDKLLKQYLIPSNCTLLQAPKLNIEVAAAIAEMVRLRDKKVESFQNQLGIGITAISKAMTSLINTDDKIEAIKTLSEGCRILCDLHHNETQARIKMITPGLAKPFLSVIQDAERDDTLFGAGLSEKIKASKTIEKQGLQIKKTVPLPIKSNAAAQPQNAPSTRHQFQGNSTGPPRYPTNRGGRGGQKRFPVPARRSAATTAVGTTSHTKSSRSRAPTRP